MAHYVLRLARRASIVLLFLLAAALGAFSGLLFASADDLPQISALDDYSPSTITRVVDVRGDPVGEFAIERRTVISYDQISPHLRQAIISSEDKTFEAHFGLSIPRLVVTALRDTFFGERAGASTITQQLARNLFAREIGFTLGDKSPERKIREILVALQIEKRYTKREILTFYCNHIPWGHGIYGTEAAARFYFGKSARDVTLAEAALLAGIIQAPARQSPYISVERATRRRNRALQRMADDGYISQEVAAKTKLLPVVTAGRPGSTQGLAPYFVEDVRQTLEERYGAARVYQGGLTVHTSLDARLQRLAEQAFDAGLRRIDKRRGFRKPAHNVVAEGHSVEEYRDERWARPIAAGAIVPAVVVATGGTGAPRSVAAGSLLLRAGKYFIEVPKSGYAWTRRTSPDFVKVGDLIEVGIATIDEATAFGTGTLEQRPAIEGALVAIDNQTGQIRAMIGGFDFGRSKFNRARQAMRQMGSTFKPIVYTAAIDRGYTPVSVIDDAPVAFPAGPGQPLYSPQNYDRTYEGPITLRRALEQSRNVPTVKLLDGVGPAVVIDYARRFGFSNPMQPYLSLALGAAEASLLEATSAYTVFPRQGVHMTPYEILRVLDRQGNVLEENRPRASDAIRADTAFVMTSLLRGVATRGTAASAASLDWPVAGKTGTMDDYTDAWFIGFDPDITIGVWIGFDEKKSLGRGETGTTAALPIWIDLMKARLELRGRDPKPEFPAPGNIVVVSVDKATGVPSNGGDTIAETFIAGTQPTAVP